MMSYINTANLVVSMCGYNTITEVLQKGKKAIVIPRVKPGQEQLIRAQSMAKVGLIKMIHPELLNPDLLMGNLFSTLNSVEYSSYKNSLNFAGLSKVSDYLTMLLFKSLYTNNNQPLALKTA